MAGVGTTDISFSGLRTAWGNASYAGGSDPGATNISLSEFYGATFTDGTSAPASGEISISDFSGKTFGSQASGNVTYESGDFRGYTSQWSTHTSYLKGINASTTAQTYTGSTDITGKTIQLLSGQGTVYSYILLSPNSSTETPGMVVDRTDSSAMNEATIWFKLRSGSLGSGVMGILPLDVAMTGTTTKDKWTNQKTYIHNKNAASTDRLTFNGPHINFSGSRDDITSSSTIVSPQYRSGTYGTNMSGQFHNITGITSGTCGSSNVEDYDTNYWFYTQYYSNFSGYYQNGDNPGMKIKWYEITLQVSLESGSSIIKPVSPATTWSSSDLTDLFSGMYVTGTGINSSDGPFVGDIHTNYMRLYKGKGASSLDFSNATSTQSNVTLTISGYLFWVLGTTDDYSNAKIIGPPHTVLPKYQATGTNRASTGEIKEWAFFIGDGTSGNNSFEFDIRNTEPGGTAFSYSVSYSLGTIPYIKNRITTDKFRAYDGWSAHSTALKGVTGSSIFTGPTTSNKQVRLYGGYSLQTVSYPILLLNPFSSSSTPGIIVDRTNSNVVDEATVWIRVVSHGNEGGTYADPWRVVQMGILAKDMTTNNWSTQKSYLTSKHATYMDRLGFHGYGYHNYAGSRDDITSSSTIVSPQYKSGTYGTGLSTTFHTRTGRTAGTQRSYNAGSAPYGFTSTYAYFFTSAAGSTWYIGYPDYRGSTKFPNHGFKIKWYETTLQCSLESGSNIIQPVSPPSNWSSDDLTDVFSGMYIYGTGINSNDGAFIGEIHTNYMKMFKQKGTSSSSLVDSDATSTQTNVTLTISGYLYWTLVTSSDSTNSNTNYKDAKIMGPPHTVLPKYQAGSQTSSPTNEIKEWAFYLGDTTSSRYNTFQYDIRHTEPRGTPFSYSVSYSSGTVPSSSTDYEFAINVGGTYVISGSLSSITPSSSGYAFTNQNHVSLSYSQYSMGARIQFLTSGKVVALGNHSRYGGKMSIFPDGSNTAAAGPVDVAGNGVSSSTNYTRNYRYTTLSTPLSVAANSIYRLSFTNNANWYARHDISAYDSTTTSSGNIKLISGMYIYVGNHTTPVRPTTASTTWNYASTDLIFLPD